MYLTNCGTNVLYRNEENERFNGIADQAVVGDTSWSMSNVSEYASPAP